MHDTGFAAQWIRTTPMSDSKPVVDWDLARENTNDDAALLSELVTAFLTEGPANMQSIRRAIAAHDGKALRLAAHTLKGSLRIFGSECARDLAEALELKGQQGQTTGTEALTAELQQQLDAVLTALAAGEKRP
jgi:HPt (histidine-containing phosphotransfer) domain-containing protein